MYIDKWTLGSIWSKQIKSDLTQAPVLAPHKKETKLAADVSSYGLVGIVFHA